MAEDQALQHANNNAEAVRQQQVPGFRIPQHILAKLCDRFTVSLYLLSIVQNIYTATNKWYMFIGIIFPALIPMFIGKVIYLKGKRATTFPSTQEYIEGSAENL